MISERDLAADFQGFWADLLPLLTPAFVKVFNEAYMTPLIDDLGKTVKPIPIGAEQRHDLVAELAFNIAMLSWKHHLSVDSVLQDGEMRHTASEMSFALLQQYQNVTSEGRTVTEGEWQEARGVAEVYGVFLGQRGAAAVVEFSPVIRGAGFLGSCRADLSVDQTLFEVKTVNRNIAGKDIRQVILYLALQAASGDRRWVSAGFLNPRRATWYEFSVDHLIHRTSGGRVTSEVFQEIIDFLSSREGEVDIAF